MWMRDIEPQTQPDGRTDGLALFLHLSRLFSLILIHFLALYPLSTVSNSLYLLLSFPVLLPFFPSLSSCSLPILVRLSYIAPVPSTLWAPALWASISPPVLSTSPTHFRWLFFYSNLSITPISILSFSTLFLETELYCFTDTCYRWIILFKDHWHYTKQL